MEGMTRILLVRHGATDEMKRVLCGRMPGVHLNAAGRRQINQLAKGLREEFQVDRVISSPLERAIETAEIVASEIGVQVQVDNGWTELDYGTWTGETIERIRGLDSWRCYDQSRSTCVPPAGESLTQVQGRAFDALQRIVCRGAEETLVLAVVSHGDVIRSLLALVLGIPLDHLHRFEISPASLSEVFFSASEAKVSYINRTYRSPSD